MTEPPDEDATTPDLARSSAWMALGTVVSRVTGFARLLLIAFTIGTLLDADLFNNANTIPNALYIPIEAVSSDSGVTVVYRRDGGSIVKQEIETGTMSDDEVVVLRGLEEEDRVLLMPPIDAAQLTLVRLTGPSIKSKDILGDSARGTPLQAGGPKDTTAAAKAAATKASPLACDPDTARTW